MTHVHTAINLNKRRATLCIDIKCSFYYSPREFIIDEDPPLLKLDQENVKENVTHLQTRNFNEIFR